ncbi:hypothetical protein M0813_29859 [Anaeramoeba flamelloides]|uniref:Uncharacterized protein n=1 Tax=Anaeramoeba flamelloides TaxID=1746091 RepID=A0ABQ8XNH2_9EUKA|nr:hypothetical protein M0813_29859 [Anaeramoeba flamelloides]
MIKRSDDNFQIELLFIECVDLSLQVCKQIRRSQIKELKQVKQCLRPLKKELEGFQKSKEKNYERLSKNILATRNSIDIHLEQQKTKKKSSNYLIQSKSNLLIVNIEDLVSIFECAKGNLNDLGFYLGYMLELLKKENVFLLIDLVFKYETEFLLLKSTETKHLVAEIKNKAKTILSSYYDLWIEKNFFLLYQELTLQFCLESIDKEVDMILVINRINEWVKTAFISQYINEAGLTGKQKDLYIQKMTKPFQIIISKKIKYIKSNQLEKILSLGWFQNKENCKKLRDRIENLKKDRRKKNN